MRLIKNLLADFSKEFYDWIFFCSFHQSTSDSGFESSKTPDRQPIQDVFISISRTRLLVNGKTNPVPKCKRQIRKNLALYCKSSVISINVYLDQYMKYITALHLIEYYNNCVTFIGQYQYPQRSHHVSASLVRNGERSAVFRSIRDMLHSCLTDVWSLPRPTKHALKNYWS